MPEHAPKRQTMPLEQQIRNRYKDSIIGRHTTPTNAVLQIGEAVIHYDMRGGKLFREIYPNTATFSPTELSVFRSMATEAMERERLAQEPRQQAAE